MNQGRHVPSPNDGMQPYPLPTDGKRISGVGAGYGTRAKGLASVLTDEEVPIVAVALAAAPRSSLQHPGPSLVPAREGPHEVRLRALEDSPRRSASIPDTSANAVGKPR